MITIRKTTMDGTVTFAGADKEFEYDGHRLIINDLTPGQVEALLHAVDSSGMARMAPLVAAAKEAQALNVSEAAPTAQAEPPMEAAAPTAPKPRRVRKPRAPKKAVAASAPAETQVEAATTDGAQGEDLGQQALDLGQSAGTPEAPVDISAELAADSGENSDNGVDLSANSAQENDLSAQADLEELGDEPEEDAPEEILSGSGTEDDPIDVTFDDDPEPVAAAPAKATPQVPAEPPEPTDNTAGLNDADAALVRACEKRADELEGAGKKPRVMSMIGVMKDNGIDGAEALRTKANQLRKHVRYLGRVPDEYWEQSLERVLSVMHPPTRSEAQA